MKKGYKHTEETRKKMSDAKKGKRPSGYEKIKLLPPWNKGLTSATDERVRRNSENTSIGLKQAYKEGRLKTWNDGIKIDRSQHPNMGHHNKHSEETKKRMSAIKIKNPQRYWLGKKLTVETKRKVSDSHKLNGIIPPSRKGTVTSPEAKLKKSEAQRGSKHYNWQGGITPKHQTIRMSLDFREWRKKVFKRDDYTCQKYKVRGCKLHAHHILNFSQHPELRFEVSNGITLSDKAHKEFHKIYGKKNNTLEQLKDFLNHE